MALAQRATTTPSGRWVVALLGITGAGLFFGDGCITPAISVLSAVEGLKVVSPAFEDAVLPISVVVLVALFLVQYRGTGADGRGVRPGDGAVVRHPRPARPVRDRRGAGGAGAPSRRTYAVDFRRIPPASPPSSPWAPSCSP